MELHSLASVAARHRKIGVALCAGLWLMPRPADAQGTLEDYRRAATFSQRFEKPDGV